MPTWARVTLGVAIVAAVTSVAGAAMVLTGRSDDHRRASDSFLPTAAPSASVRKAAIGPPDQAPRVALPDRGVAALTDVRPSWPDTPAAQPDIRPSADLRAVSRRSTRRRSAALRVSTLCEGAAVWATVLVDGKRVGQSPLVLRGLRPGPHRVEARRPGFHSETRKVHLAAGHSRSLLLELRQE